MRTAWMFAAAVLGLLLLASPAAAAGHEPLNLPVWSVTPFVLLLLCIAVLPVAAEHFWHQDRNKAVVVAVLATPVVLYLIYLQLATGEETLSPLVHELAKYASFIIMLGSLYTVAGGVVVRGDLRPTPLNNAGILALGALLANVIGTTGASVLLIRPFLRINAGRKNNVHLPLFFILLVSNLGGCLTPLGDPPLYMGYLNGVPFSLDAGAVAHVAVRQHRSPDRFRGLGRPRPAPRAGAAGAIGQGRADPHRREDQPPVPGRNHGGRADLGRLAAAQTGPPVGDMRRRGGDAGDGGPVALLHAAPPCARPTASPGRRSPRWRSCSPASSSRWFRRWSCWRRTGGNSA